ncbi:MAG: multicopper oxidase family protein [Alphaproteobacteria bacterium]|nr:multicopper oxidase family protein [Alphaproteobacteria bacterium]MDE2336689.1 multicopper oxidase family protein [Alphaproteobacteria bacterium]
MNRRELLKLMSTTALGVMSAAVLPPLSARAAEQDTLEVTLTARPYTYNPLPDVTFSGLAYNGQVPGPVIRTRAGQRFRARFINHTGAGSTIHWHGMILPNDMDGVPDITQEPVWDGGTFTYDFTPAPAGFRWYHSHAGTQSVLGLFGAFIIDDPRDEKADVEAVLVFHDVPDMRSFAAALKDMSDAPMAVPPGLHPHTRMSGMKMGGMGMNGMEMGDEVAYLARCVNGATFPHTKPVRVKVGDRVRLRILNASPTMTHYIALGGHRLTVTHSDGNPMERPVTVEALRVGVGERFDAWFEVTQAGAWLLEDLAGDRLSRGQAVLIHTEGMEKAPPVRPAQTLAGVEYFTYPLAGAAGPLKHPLVDGRIDVTADLTLGGGERGVPRWTMNGKIWPHTQKIFVKRGDRVLVRFKNQTGMDHPMHLHGHVFKLVEVNGKSLRHPLLKDTSLISANGGTGAWFFEATSPPGRWVLHCHNEVHMADGMMTEVFYEGPAAKYYLKGV